MSILANRIRGVDFFKSPAIKLSTGGGPVTKNPDVQVLRTGKFKHPKYGDFEITKLTLTEMKANFDNKIRGVDIAFDYFHNSDQEASGWPTELYLLDEGNELWAKVDWTPTAQVKLSDREIRYFSPDFGFKWQDEESGKVYNNVLFGGGLTNRPFVKEMAAIVASEGEFMNEKEFKEMQAKVLKLAEDMTGMAAENVAMKKKLAEYAENLPKPAPTGENPEDDEDDEDDSPEGLKKQLAKAKEQNAKLMTEMAESKKEKVLAEKTGKFNLLLSEGKACAAQKEAFLKGDTEEFIKLAQPVNLNGKGHGGDGGAAGGASGSGDREDRVLKLAEEKCKADKSLQMTEAISIANKEIKA